MVPPRTTMPTRWKRIQPQACRWKNSINRSSAAEPNAPRPPSEGLFDTFSMDRFVNRRIIPR
jgi:hypothetical protein